MKKELLRTMDLISDLPDPIVHHIMSFLTTLDVTKLSILSKRFFSLWGSFPVIDLHQERFARTHQGTLASIITDAFLDHILNSVLLRGTDIILSEFRVNADLEGILADERFDLAILFALANGVKCMELNLGFVEYLLPAEFASNLINVLRLEGLQLDLHNLIQVCPSLRTVSLTSCVIPQDIKFSSKTLTEIQLHYCGTVRSVKINAPNLHLFLFDSGKEIIEPKPCQIDVLQCQNIMYLSLNNVVNGRDWIEEHVYSLSKLKTFILNGCQDIERIRGWNDKLERVEFSHCPVLTSIQLKATSLESFVYESAHWDRACNITFLASKCIKHLSITGAAIVTDQWLEGQLFKMTRLERLSLNACNFLNKIKVFHEKLESVELYSCLGLVEADINTPRLVSFAYESGQRERVCKITFLASKYIKDLSIKGTAYTDQWLKDQLAKMTRLEKLSLKACNSLKNIKVVHEKLQSLELHSCHGLAEVDIDTPQLVSFMYHGKIIKVGKMVTQSNCTATLSMEPWITYDNESFCRWWKLLSFFGHCKALKLICSTHREVMIPELHRERLLSPLYDLKHLEIEINLLEKIDRDLVDSLLWLSPLPETLHISSGSSGLQMIIKFVYSDMIEEEEDKNPFCCASKPIKCWKHHLKSLEIQSSDVSPKNESIELQKYFLTNAKIRDSLCFRLGKVAFDLEYAVDGYGVGGVIGMNQSGSAKKGADVRSLVASRGTPLSWDFQLLGSDTRDKPNVGDGVVKFCMEQPSNSGGTTLFAQVQVFYFEGFPCYKRKVTVIVTIKQRNRETNTMDLISDLPDPIVHHIMSFLTTSDVTTLSILSRRVSANLKGISAHRRFDLTILTVLTNGVRRMELNLGFAEYVLPTEFASKSINVLRLKGLQLDLCNLIQVCPSLRTLCLTSCVILQDIKFSSKTLTEIELYSCGVKFIKINAPNLYLFRFHATLVTDQWLEAQLAKMTSLERLWLEECNSLRKIKVYHEKLQILELYSCHGLVESDIDTPQLVSFMYHGDVIEVAKTMAEDAFVLWALQSLEIDLQHPQGSDDT
ncbi:hypothetical protein L1987_16939 [Smallanthus sonchifolius]|uniref:Uncharacterized protein n=1 Tax=Smallanthus sonchifolius TaxID=185202 RepID=A0ACB9IYZ6_9ASTR|nr:hypothetical protein L1987_16939 [Smallanthus sonchifolius]